jgi:hypothetical protein
MKDAHVSEAVLRFGFAQKNRARREVSHVRVSTAFKKVLGLAGAWVERVKFCEVGVVVS